MQEVYSGNIKLNNQFHLANKVEAQLTAIYLAPDIIPQGTMDARYSVDFGVKKTIQNGKGEIFFNVTDLFNSMVMRRKIQGQDFNYTSADYNETQVARLGYTYKF